jgi:nitrogen fixation/metabolism regulation signal transduction histidine kinase
VREEFAKNGEASWQREVELMRRNAVILLRGSTLPAAGGGGFVVVFDDITRLIEAQRATAWAEVARRLAHEIKNPLTPIQLSAERMRRRFLATMSPPDAEMLERSTRTIVQQVESMQQMVNAFSEYARAPEMNMTHFNLNQLVSEVVDLYRSHHTHPEVKL